MKRSITLLLTLFLITFEVNAHSQSDQTDDNLPMPATELMHLLQYEDFQILSFKKADKGVSGAAGKMTLSFPNDSQKVDVKWKEGHKVTGEWWNNSPRRNAAAYKVQQLFLDPPDYVVPPTTTRCIPLAEYQKIRPGAQPNLGDFQCVYGELQAWLKNVTTMRKRLDLDRKRFEEDPRYAFQMANMNLLCYLVKENDAAPENFFLSTDLKKFRIYSYDHDFSFKWEWHNFWVPHWNKIRVPALPKQSIDRLRKVTDEELDRLGVVEQFDPDKQGVLRHVEPRENLSPWEEARLRPNTFQMGLTRPEIDNVKKRLRNLLKEVDQGKWKLF